MQFIDIQPITVLREMMADYLTEEKIDKIPLSQEQFEKHFRIIGMRTDGQTESRGRKKKTDL